MTGIAKRSRPGESGFTLIELSIVLVIIGLIVGGVLVGQDLIKAAETRATLAQIEKYNSAVNTFRNKYNGLPGDLLNASSQFGFAGGDGTSGNRDGNGFIGNYGNATGVGYGGETAYFWADLSTANLIDGSLSAASNNALLTITSSSQVAAALPAAKLGKGNYVFVYYNNGYNWFGIGGASASTGVWTIALDLTPNQAFNMDKKVDDGIPFTGIVQAITTTPGAVTVTTWATDANVGTTSGKCATATGNTGVYNMNTVAYQDIAACALGMRFN